MTLRHHLALLVLGLSLLMAGCVGQPHREPRAHPHSPGHGGVARHRDPALPPRTGVAACDDYLASYRACHRAAGIFAPDQIESRYQEMRRSLLRDSLDPGVRPQLATRCDALARSLRQALHGKSCGPTPPPAETGTVDGNRSS